MRKQIPTDKANDVVEFSKLAPAQRFQSICHGQGPSGRTTPWGDREEGEDGVPPLQMAADTLASGHAG